jgi:hypothetical protein
MLSLAEKTTIIDAVILWDDEKEIADGAPYRTTEGDDAARRCRRSRRRLAVPGTTP